MKFLFSNFLILLHVLLHSLSTKKWAMCMNVLVCVIYQGGTWCVTDYCVGEIDLRIKQGLDRFKLFGMFIFFLSLLLPTSFLQPYPCPKLLFSVILFILRACNRHGLIAPLSTGAGVSGLTSAIALLQAGYKDVTVIGQYIPGDMTTEYTSPWAGASVLSFASAMDKRLIGKIQWLIMQQQRFIHHMSCDTTRN